MEPIIDHVGINVSDYEKSKAFYIAALAPLGITLLMEFGKNCGFGRGGKPEVWLSGEKSSYQTDDQRRVITPFHVCLKATDRASVEAFHAAAIAAGAKDFGAPGIRAQYHPNYFGAFVLDPDGHNLEAVFHGGA